METIKLRHTRVFQSLWTSQKRINAFRGGARSSKTYSILQAIIYWFISGKFGDKDYPKGNFTIARETLPALRASAYKDFIEILHACNFYQKVEHRKTLLEFSFQGREVHFISTDDLNSAKLRGRQHTFIYLNEANTISKEAWEQMIMRTEEFAILDYNPAGYETWVKNYIEGTRFDKGDVKLDVSTYFDNIENIPQAMVDEIEGYKDTDMDLYNVYAKGFWVQSRNLVFEKVHIIKEMPKNYDREFYGIDFGYNDPNVLVRVLLKGNNIYIEQLFYKRKMSINELADAIISAHVSKVYCDHNPLLRMELKSRGVNIRNARKGKDSIDKGIAFIRTHKIHILETSLETIDEFRKYKYKLDSDNKPTDTILEFADHSPDAVRYAVSKAGKSKVRIK